MSSSSESQLKVVLMGPNSVAPARASDGAAGYDLYSTRFVIIPAGETRAINTGIQIALPPGTYGRIAPRSNLALYDNVHVVGGVIDPDYRGEICVILANNHRDEAYSVKARQRIAQLIIEKIELPTVCVVDSLFPTERGSGGFGSTGSF